LLFLALVAGVSYAVRDRMKEVGRVWLASGIQRFAAQRFTRFTLASGRAVDTARESFDELTTPHSDPLGSELGTTGTDTHLKFVHAGTIHDVGLSDASHCLRMLFRYDLTPLLPRLHDAVKQLAVRDSETGKLRFVDAPRTYRVPVRLRVLYQGILEERSAVLVINKYGLHRLDRAVSI
jgi:hypothetical protein